MNTTPDQSTTPKNWEQRCIELWARLDALPQEEFVAAMSELVASYAGEDGVGVFEMACAHDSTGHSDLAVPAYREALTLGLDEYRRRRTHIQLASSLRNVGRHDDAVALLRNEATQGTDELDDAVTAFQALLLADEGREREALPKVLVALAKHLPRYQRSVANFGQLLTPTSDA